MKLFPLTNGKTRKVPKGVTIKSPKWKINWKPKPQPRPK
jgi:hypothetical protein